DYEDGANPETQQILDHLITTTQGSSLHTENDLQSLTQNALNSSNSIIDEHLRFGSCIALQHSTTLKYLSSKLPISNETLNNGNKDQVFAARRKSENELWMVLQGYGERRRLKMGEIVPFNTQIRLKHIISRRYLRSHPDYSAPISDQQDVCHGDEHISDLNDNWLVQRHSYSNYYDNSGYWLAGDAITLRHIQTGATLHSHNIMLDDDNQEVTCYGPGHEENDKWRAERIENISDFIRNAS
ncbi:7424_t:CDS:2, partial [Funneliformis geosporum]